MGAHVIRERANLYRRPLSTTSRPLGRRAIHATAGDTPMMQKQGFRPIDAAAEELALSSSCGEGQAIGLGCSRF